MKTTASAIFALLLSVLTGSAEDIAQLEKNLASATTARDKMEVLHLIAQVEGKPAEQSLRRFVQQGGESDSNVVARAERLLGFVVALQNPRNPYQESEHRFQLKSPIQQVNKYRDLIQTEIESPTKPREGFGGGMITHEYQLKQFEIGLFNVLARPAVGGRDIAEHYVIQYVRDLAKQETNAEAKQVYEHVLERFDNLKKRAEPEN